MNHDRNKLHNLALYNRVTRCGINYAGTQIMQDFQNNGKLEFLCFESPTVLFASQHNLFRTK